MLTKMLRFLGYVSRRVCVRNLILCVYSCALCMCVIRVFDGYLDSMSIYQSALDADKVAAIFEVCFLLCVYTCMLDFVMYV